MAFLTSNNPFMLGFDSLERMLDRAAKNSENYPPYNIEQIDPSHLRITIAVAGFAEEDLTIEVEDKQLIVRGQHAEDEKTPEHQYLYRGIAARQFQRSFILADGVEVIDAHLDNGLLHIDLEQNEPETKIRQIKISKKSEKTSEKPKVEKKF
ncbi:MAG: Hsp20 family protein [Alphaproteobacteria bacterium]|nr:Hsp20 family protein [Alphaproteobacteria bacterium]